MAKPANFSSRQPQYILRRYIAHHLESTIHPNIAMSDSNDSSFNILGSSKLNTVDGKNPLKAPDTSSTQSDSTAGQQHDEAYRKACQAAHDALEDKLRDEEREKKWTGKW
ncbi:hypothetical protein ACLMJK_008063 [Lecanora helva]